MQSSLVGTKWHTTGSTFVFMAYTKDGTPDHKAGILKPVRNYRLLGFATALPAVSTAATTVLGLQAGANLAVYIPRDCIAITVIAGMVTVLSRPAKFTREAPSFDIVYPHAISATPATPPVKMPFTWGGLAGKGRLERRVTQSLLWPYFSAITSGLGKIFTLFWMFATAKNLTSGQPLSGRKGQQGLINVLKAKSGYPSSSSLVLELAQCR